MIENTIEMKHYRKPYFEKRENGGKNIKIHKLDRKTFIPDIYIPLNYRLDCLRFAHDTVYGELNKSNKSFDEKFERTKHQRLIDTFQGKLSECAEYIYFIGHGLECSAPDMRVFCGHENLDGEIRRAITNIKKNTKGSKHYSQIVLLERKKLNENGFYIFGDKPPIKYDITVFCRIAIENDKDEYEELDNYLKGINKNNLEEYISVFSKKRIAAEISGILTQEMLDSIIKNGDEMVLNPKDDLYLGIKLIAENYFCLLKDLKNKDEWILELKK